MSSEDRAAFDRMVACATQQLRAVVRLGRLWRGEAVAAARITTDHASGQSKGFVEMPSASEAQAAITGLHGTALLGRTLHVNEARPRAGSSRPERRSGGEGADPRGRQRG